MIRNVRCDNSREAVGTGPRRRVQDVVVPRHVLRHDGDDVVLVVPGQQQGGREAHDAGAVQERTHTRDRCQSRAKRGRERELVCFSSTHPTTTILGIFNTQPLRARLFVCNTCFFFQDRAFVVVNVCCVCFLASLFARVTSGSGERGIGSQKKKNSPSRLLAQRDCMLIEAENG